MNAFLFNLNSHFQKYLIYFYSNLFPKRDLKWGVKNKHLTCNQIQQTANIKIEDSKALEKTNYRAKTWANINTIIEHYIYLWIYEQ